MLSWFSYPAKDFFKIHSSLELPDYLINKALYYYYYHLIKIHLISELCCITQSFCCKFVQKLLCRL